MFLYADDIRHHIEDSFIVCPCDVKPHTPEWEEFKKNRLACIEGSGFDITLYKVFSPESGSFSPFIGKEKRKLPLFRPLYDDKKDVPLFLYPGYYLLQSYEVISLPPSLGGLVLPRSSFFSAQCLTQGTRICPGFSGQLRVALWVIGTDGVILEKGTRFATVLFFPFTLGSTDPYAGIWYGDKVTTDDVERAY